MKENEHLENENLKNEKKENEVIESKEIVEDNIDVETTLPKKNRKTSKIILRILLFIIIAIIIFALTAFLSSWYFINNKLDKINYVDLTSENVTVNSGVEEELSEYRSIALLGLDTREDTFTGSRSDCIMIVNINNYTNDVSITSVYRDTYLDIEGYGLDKVTHAYAYGDAALSLSTLNRNLDLNIKEFVTVNFDTVKTVVDAIGGIDLSVTDAESKSIPGISSGGTYHLNGTQALAYARIRKIDSDYVRAERMRTVLIEVFTKAKSMNVGQLTSLVDIIVPHISTNISKNEIISLLPKIFSYNVTTSIGWPYEIRSFTTPTWYGVPVTLEQNVKKLHEQIFNETDYEVSDTVKQISNKIINRTGYSN